MNIGVAVIGCGDRGANHAGEWNKRHESRVLTVFDIDRTRCDALAASTGARSCASWEEAILFEGVNVVSVCVPTVYHGQITEFAAESGCHVFCEKPLALTLEEGKKTLDTIERTGIIYMPCFQHRDRTPYPRQRELFREGTLGTPVRFRITDIREVRPKVAMHQRSMNGGVVVDLGCHMIDMMRYITGEEPLRVSATGSVFGRGKARLEGITDLAVDEVNAEVSYTGGHQLQMYLNWGMPEGYPGFGEQMLVGPLAVAQETQAGCEVGFGDHTETWPGPKPGTAYRIDRFVDAVEGIAPPDVTAEDAFVALKVCLAILQSIRDGVAIDL